MSNHSGSYLLNDLLLELEKEGVFEYLGKERLQKLLLWLVKHAGRKYDCNQGEILNDIGPVAGLCYCCLKQADKFRGDGLCKDCFGPGWDDADEWVPETNMI